MLGLLSLMYTFTVAEHAEQFRQWCREHKVCLDMAESSKSDLVKQVEVLWTPGDDEKRTGFEGYDAMERAFFTEERADLGVHALRTSSVYA